jgi:uncharacterized protein
MPTTPEDAALTALDLAKAGRFDDVRAAFAAPLQAMVAPDALARGWSEALSREGAITSIGTPVTDPSGAGAVVVRVPVKCQRGGFTVIAAVNDLGELAGLQLAPLSAAAPVEPWQAPAYVDAGRFDEREVTLGSGPMSVPGTLSIPRAAESAAGTLSIPRAAKSAPGTLGIPRAAESVPALVLLPGSGALDRDETIGRNKPLKDVAWGLASRGVAVLRFDKVTHAHAGELRDAQDFTLSDEYVPSALAAIGLLAHEPTVDPARIFLLGHSLGGTVAPRIAAADPSVAGLILMAGGAQPLHWTIVRQARHLASLRPQDASAADGVIDSLSEQASLVDSPELTTETPPSQLPLGAPAAYWLDLRDYDPAAAAAALHKPILILQGGRDYQVTVDDDLARWQGALGDDPQVTIRVYPEHNHLFTPGSGPSSPAEYEPAQHVDGAVIADIGDWISGIAGVPAPG